LYCASCYYQSFIYSPTDALVSCLKNNIKIYIKIYIKTAPTCFGVKVTPLSASALICVLHVSVLQLHHHHGVH